MPGAPIIREGDIAFAVSIQTIWDLLTGQYDVPVSLTRHSSPTDPTLTLSNRTAGGPILRIYDEGGVAGGNAIFDLTAAGLNFARVTSYLELNQQAVAPAGPGLGVNRMRIYVRGGNLYSKFADSAELQIPFGAPPGPAKRREFWYAGS